MSDFISLQSNEVESFKEISFAAFCFLLQKYQIWKSDSWVFAIYQITKTVYKPVFDWFNLRINILLSVFKINSILYSQYLIFFKANQVSW